MKIIVEETINADHKKVFAVLTDIKNCDQYITGITKLEVLNDPDGLVGFRWRETRQMFGQEATEEMEITKYQQDKYYRVEAFSHGTKYISIMSVEPIDKNNTKVVMEFEGIPKSTGAKLMSLMGFLFKGATKKALAKDLSDIKNHIESN